MTRITTKNVLAQYFWHQQNHRKNWCKARENCIRLRRPFRCCPIIYQRRCKRCVFNQQQVVIVLTMTRTFYRSSFEIHTIYQSRSTQRRSYQSFCRGNGCNKGAFGLICGICSTQSSMLQPGSIFETKSERQRGMGAHIQCISEQKSKTYGLNLQITTTSFSSVIVRSPSIFASNRISARKGDHGRNASDIVT